MLGATPHAHSRSHHAQKHTLEPSHEEPEAAPTLALFFVLTLTLLCMLEALLAHCCCLYVRCTLTLIRTKRALEAQHEQSAKSVSTSQWDKLNRDPPRDWPNHSFRGGGGLSKVVPEPQPIIPSATTKIVASHVLSTTSHNHQSPMNTKERRSRKRCLRLSSCYNTLFVHTRLQGCNMAHRTVTLRIRGSMCHVKVLLMWLACCSDQRACLFAFQSLACLKLGLTRRLTFHAEC